MRDRFDVAIVGAGPAGSSLAARLAGRGYQVALLDKKRFPRAKPCGEFLSPECAPALAELGVLDRVMARAGRAVRGMRLYGYGRQASGEFKAVGRSRVPAAFGGGYAVAREILDSELLEAARVAGATVFEGLTCRGLLRDGDVVDGVLVSDATGEPFELRARWTIGADGVRSAVARALGVQRRIPWLDKFALTTHFENVPALPTAELHVFAGGYFAAAPIADDTLSVNLVVDRARLRIRNGDPWDDFLAAHLQRAPELAERLRTSRRSRPVRGIGPLAYRTTEQVFAGAALVGDACGYVDPMTGEGIFFALRTAELLAVDLDRALTSHDRGVEALRPYARARRRQIGPRLMLSKLLQHGLRSETVARAMLHGLEARSGLADLLVSFTGDYVSFRDALRPSVWWRALVTRGAA